MRIALAFLLVGCVAQEADPDGDGTGSGSGSGTGTTPPPPPVATGTYRMRTEIDLTVEAVLPETAADVVVTLRDFSTSPAHTLLDLAEQAGLPAVGQLRDALPDYLESKLEGWIDGEIAKLELGGVPVTQLAGNIAALAETALTRFAIDSELAIDGNRATHTLNTLDLTPAGLDATFALGALPGDVISATATCSSQNGALSIGDHGYAIAYGEYIWRAANDTVAAQYGTDIRGTLGAAVDCPALAARVAGKCYLGICVGHQAELAAICERGLDEVVERVHAKLAEMRFDAVHFAAGTAKLVDANADGRADRIDQGVWTAEINAGMGLRHVPATFTATSAAN